ncbi:MAG: 50S ribosomal protein L15 [Candidatus Eisenbacteria bacterium]|nr:50S ribosomal protein L15 [Candidatus Eisenbacteria bacterium]
MKLGDMRPAHGARRRRRRFGVGTGSGRGGTCGKGTKGQKSRSGARRRPGFEGGQMPLQRRVPKRGFTPLSRKRYQILDLRRLADWDTSQEISARTLAESGMVRSAEKPVKILGTGEAPAGLKVKVNAISAQARKKIESAGGTVEVIGSSS